MSVQVTFKECDSCARQLGSPTLCASCQHNRRVINSLAPLLNQNIAKHRSPMCGPDDCIKCAQEKALRSLAAPT